jgi:hypothetical protein
MTDFIFSYLKKVLPSITWSVGSVVRELIASPVAKVAEAANTALTNQLNAADVYNYVTYPDDYAEQIDEVFNALELGETGTTSSTGIVTIYMNTANIDTIGADTTFYYLDSAIVVSEAVRPGVYDNGGPGRFSQIRQLAEDSYAFDVPVITPIINQYISQGVSLSWYNAPDNVYDIKVTSPVSGGVSVLTTQDKANKIRDYICPAVLSMNEGLNKTLRQGLPNIVADASYATDIDDTATSYAYVKTLKTPGYFTVKVKGVKINNMYHVDTTIPGALYVDSCYFNNKQVTISDCSVANNHIVCTVNAASEDPVVDLMLYVYGMEQMIEVQEFIDSFTKGSPYNIVAVAPSSLNLSIEFKYTGDLISDEELATIVTNIQSKPMNPTITDTIVDSLLNSVGARLVGSCVYVTERVDGSRRRQQFTPDLSDALSDKVAVYIHSDNIKAVYV